MSFDTWLEILQNFGVAVAAMIAMAWALAKTAKFVAEKVAVPLVDAHKQFLVSMEKNATENTLILGKLADNVDKMGDSISVLSNSVERACKYPINHNPNNKHHH